jgi:integrase
VRAGVDLVQVKRAAREEEHALEAAERAKTFEECAQAYIDEQWDGWSEKHRAQWPSSLKRYAYPTIGHLTIAEIKPSHIHDLLKPIWVEKRETANRVRGRIETIIAKNVDVDDKDFRNPAELTKQLREKLPKRPKRAVRHHPALPYADAPRYMAKLAAAPGTAAAMLRFAARSVETICTAIGEILGAFTSDECANYFQNPGYAQT